MHYTLPIYDDVKTRRQVVLGNWRATPTPELQQGELQPYDGVVHNGTIANDSELGIQPGEIDSQCLPRVLDRSSLPAFVHSLGRIKGSYAVAALADRTVYLATNYKPLYYARLNWVTYFSSMARHFEGILPFGHAPVAVKPYTALDLVTGAVLDIPTAATKRAVVIASAGLDSTVAAAKLVTDGWDVCLLHFTYGCNAQTREAQRIPRLAASMGCQYAFVDVDLKGMLSGASTLFGDESKIVGAVEGAEYAHEWVPARNMVFVSLAVAWAEAHGYHAVALGNNLEEAGAYPDNEEEFTHLLDLAAPYAVQAHYGMRVLSPVGNLMKHEIVALGLALGAPFEYTWSCYRGGDTHCGECGPCLMRRLGFQRAGGQDPVFL